MSFLKKIFGKKQKIDPGELKIKRNNKSTKAAQQKAHKQGTIKAYDKYGREIIITRDDWLNSVLLGNIEKAWNDPEELANLIVSGLKDEFFYEIEHATAHLCKIDTQPARAAVYHAIVFLQTERPKQAENILKEHIRKYGEEGCVLTNLAKAQFALGNEAESIQTLWHGLELDPNQDNGLGWYEIIHREKGGEAAGVTALERVAALPGSWRAQLWLARHALKSSRLEDAISAYQEALATAESPPPKDLLMQMSGDLGNSGYLQEILKYVTPYFDPKTHGIEVGNNLIKANIDTGQLDAARTIIKKLQLLQRPDWQQSLGFWEGELSKAACAVHNSFGKRDLKISLLRFEGSLLLKDKALTAVLFPDKIDNAPRVCFIGSTAETLSKSNEIVQQPSDNPGRFSRGLPLLLAEHTYLTTDARTCTLMPWATGDHASFVLSGLIWKDEDAAVYARNGGKPNDYVVISHLKVRGENWQLLLRLVRTIDAKCLASFEYSLAEFAPHTIIDQLLSDLDTFLKEEAEIKPEPGRGFALPGGTEINHYLFRLEQSLALHCYAMDSSDRNGLSNPTEIINGIIQTCASNPNNLNCRLLLLRALAALKKIDAKLTTSFQEKVGALTQEYPLEPFAQKLTIEELNQILTI